MWKTTTTPVFTAFFDGKIYTCRWVKFGEMCNLFSTFPILVDNGEWNVNNRLKLVMRN